MMSPTRNLAIVAEETFCRPPERPPLHRYSALMRLLLCVLFTVQLSGQSMADRVRAEFLHSWRAYERHAWGHDELRPMTRTPRDWYGQSLMITPVDSLDALLLMGFTDEAEKARKLIVEELSFDKDIEVKNFEITIRVLGGLLSAYEMTGDPELLRLADDLGTRLLPVFSSPTGMPYMFVNLRTGQTCGARTNPAEIGTLILEFGALSRHTNKPVYFEKAKRALVELFNRRSEIGLVGEEIDVETGSTRIVRYSVIDDFGRSINPLLLEGQVHGGTVQGIGQALFEHGIYDAESAQLLSGSFMDYALPRADDVPAFECSFHHVPTSSNPLGVKGAGEAGAVGAPPAVINAIVDALQPVTGLAHIDMPATREKLWRALRGGQAAVN